MAAKGERTFSQALYRLRNEHPWMRMNRIVRHLAKEFPHPVIDQFVKNLFVRYAKSRER